MAGNVAPNIVNDDSLLFYLDTVNIKSYVNGSTTWRDISKAGNNGTLVNSPAFSSANGGSIVFDGTDDYCNIPISAVPTGSQATVSFWTKFNVTQASSIFSAYNSAGQRQINIHLTWSDSVAYWDCGATGGTYDRINSSTLTTAQKTGWHNWVFTKDATAGTMVIYLDGISLASGTGKTNTIGTISTASKRCAIASFDDTMYYSGNISSMLLYNRVLSTTEITQNFNATKTRFGL